MRFQLDNFKKRYKDHTTEYRILSLDPHLDENYQLNLELENPIQEDVLNAMRADLLDFLRHALSNYSINVKGKVIEGTYVKQAFTINEKLNFLIDQNPMIGEFKKRFGLDTDY